MSEQSYYPQQQAGQVPWTLQQTFIGILFTLVPWMVFAILLSGSKPARTVALSPSADLANAIIVFILSTLIEAAFLIAPLYFARRAFRSAPLPHWSLVANALGFRRFAVGKTISWLVLFFLLILVANSVYQSLISALHLPLQTNDQLILQQAKNAPFTTYATLIVSVLVAPICEEVFFRGFVLPGFLRGMPVAMAIILSSLIFAVAHADIGSFVVLFVIGIALGFLRWRTGSIWPGIILHTINNGLGALLIFLTIQGVIK